MADYWRGNLLHDTEIADKLMLSLGDNLSSICYLTLLDPTGIVPAKGFHMKILLD